MIPPVRIAHRGASGAGLAPENTLAAIEHAIQIGVDVVEIDIQVTADGKLVVVHDATLDRTTDSKGSIRDQTADRVRRADAGSWFDMEFSDQQVPLLEEALELARNRVLVLIEIKADRVAEQVLRCVEDAAAGGRVIIQSFSRQTVQRVKLLDPSIPAALLVGQLPATPSRVRARSLVRQVLQTGANALAIWHAALTPVLLEEMRKRAIAVWTWTVDEEIAMRDLIMMGANGIITNVPNLLNDVIDDLQQENRIQLPLGRRRVRRSRWGRRRQLRKLHAKPQKKKTDQNES